MPVPDFQSLMLPALMALAEAGRLCSLAAAEVLGHFCVRPDRPLRTLE